MTTIQPRWKTSQVKLLVAALGPFVVTAIYVWLSNGTDWLTPARHNVVFGFGVVVAIGVGIGPILSLDLPWLWRTVWAVLYLPVMLLSQFCFVFVMACFAYDLCL